MGYDNIDVAACARRGVVCTNTPGVLVDATADIAMALILASTRRIGEAERMVRAGGTWSWSMFFMLGTGLQGKTLGIVGLGQIGTATARRARAFGMEIVYSGRRRADAEREAELEAAYLELDELLAASDVVSIHCPLNAATRHLIDARGLGLMKPTAYLVNTSRGPVVDEAALAQALRAGTIAGAGPRRVRARAGASSPACSSSRTSCCSRTLARPRSRRARRWACWRRRTPSRCWRESRRSRRSVDDQPRGVRPLLAGS